MVDAVIFDALGTLLQIRNRLHPYRKLLRIGAEQGRAAARTDICKLMTFEGGLEEAAEVLRIKLSVSRLAELQAMLDSELESICVYDDASVPISIIKDLGLKVGVCSNLAGVYCSKVRELIPGLDAYALSAELGVMKPSPLMYDLMRQMLIASHNSGSGAESLRFTMIGDSLKCDVHGPRAVGILGYHLDRQGTGHFRCLLDFAQLVRASV